MTNSGWPALGRYLVRERAARKVRTRQEFADLIGISVRTLDNLENARRTRYTPATLAAVEVALWWQPGSVERVLAGGRPTRHRDGELTRLLRVWPRLPVEARRVIARLAEDAVEE